MDFRAKKRAYNKMQSAKHFEADRELLNKLKPKEQLVGKDAKNEKAKEKLQREILWLLLDLVSVEEIETYRDELLNDEPTAEEQLVEKIKANCVLIEKAASKPAKETIELYNETLDSFNELPTKQRNELSLLLTNAIHKFVSAYTGKLTAHVEKADTEVIADELLTDIKDMASMLPDEAKVKIIDFAVIKNPTPGKIEKLKTIDFANEKTDNALVNELFRYFGLTATDNKKTSKLVSLKSHMELILSEELNELKRNVQSSVDAYMAGAEGATEETARAAVESLPESEREVFICSIEAQKNALKDKLDQSEEEKAELEEKNEELEEENQELHDKVDELEEEKKSSSNPSEQKS